jgi:hypothetical protein
MITLTIAGAMLFVPTVAQAANIMISPSAHWPNGQVPFYLKPALTAEQRTDFFTVTEYIEAMTSIRFNESSQPGLFVMGIRKGMLYKKHASYWLPGFQGGNVLTLNKADAPMILHEITHGLGMWHEHQRNDRDSFVQYQKLNIAAFYEINYWPQPNTMPVGDFDFESIMLYGSCDGVINTWPGFRGESCREMLNGHIPTDSSIALLTADFDGDGIFDELFERPSGHYSDTDLHGLHTIYASERIIVGDQTIASALDAQNFCDNGDVIVIGDVTITGSEAIRLNCLRRVVGDLRVDPSYGSATLSLADLVSVAGNIEVTNISALTELNLDTLEAAEHIQIDNTPNLQTVEMANLKFAFDTLTLKDTHLTVLSLPLLKHAGNIRIESNGSLSEVNLDSLDRLEEHALYSSGDGELVVRENPALETFAADRLARAEVVRFIANSELERLKLPRLIEASQLIVTENPALEIFAADRLAWAEVVGFTANSGLEVLNLPQLVYALDVEVVNNIELREIWLEKLGRNALAIQQITSGSRRFPHTIEVEDNPRLTYVNLDDVEIVNTLKFIENGGPDSRGSLMMSRLEEVHSNFYFVSNEGFATKLSAPNLKRVGKDIFINGNTRLRSVTMDQLTQAGDKLLIERNTSLESMNLSKLQRIGGDFIAADLPALGTLSAPSLVHVKGATRISTTNITSVDLSAFEKTRSLSVSNNRSLVKLKVPNLNKADVLIENNDRLTQVSLDSLKAVDHIEMVSNPNLATVFLGPLTTAPSLEFSDNARLTDISGSVTHLASLVVMDNSSQVDLTENELSVYLPYLTSIEFGDLHLENNSALRQLDGLDPNKGGSLTYIEADFIVLDNHPDVSSSANACLGSLNILNGTSDISNP